MHRRDPVRNERAGRAWRLVWLLLVLALLASSSCLGGSPRGGAVVPSGAACDDGNRRSGDGCSAAGAVEAGWTCHGAPSQCADVDEGALGRDNCAANATCTNVPGSFGCACKPGDTGNGLVCTPPAACSPNPCQHGGTCIAGSSGYTCACARGSTGPTCAQLDSATTGSAAGGRHRLVVKSDGTVWAWGPNDEGQLGDGTTTARSTPGPVGTLTGVVAVAACSTNSLAVKSDGTVWAWGPNDEDQLGGGTATDRSTPGQVINL